MTDLKTLNSQFGIANHLLFETDPGGLTLVKIDNDFASASIALQGGHVMTWTPHNAEAVIWLSPAAKLAPGKSIRGGVPICWPWFGPHESQTDFPAHGFARTTPWDVVSTTQRDDGATQLVLKLATANFPAQQWPHPTTVQYVVTVGDTLEIELVSQNTGPGAITLGEALHTYFNVSDVREISVDGLDGCHYLDKVDDFTQKQQSGPVTFSSEVDRVYVNTSTDCIIRDPAMSRQIRIAKSGSNSTVVWNPWIEKANKMGDLGDNGYLKMVCVESANADENVVTLQPGEQHTLSVRYSVEQI